MSRGKLATGFAELFLLYCAANSAVADYFTHTHYCYILAFWITRHILFRRTCGSAYYHKHFIWCTYAMTFLVCLSLSDEPHFVTLASHFEHFCYYFALPTVSRHALVLSTFSLLHIAHTPTHIEWCFSLDIGLQVEQCLAVALRGFPSFGLN